MEKFAGTIAKFEYLNDFECRRTAEQINSVLLNAKWRTFGTSSNDDSDIPAGGVRVTVGSKEVKDLMAARSTADPNEYAKRGMEIFNAFERQNSFRPTAEELIRQLNLTGISASSFASDPTVPIGTISITVGPKPHRPPSEVTKALGGKRHVVAGIDPRYRRD